MIEPVADCKCSFHETEADALAVKSRVDRHLYDLDFVCDAPRQDQPHHSAVAAMVSGHQEDSPGLTALLLCKA